MSAHDNIEFTLETRGGLWPRRGPGAGTTLDKVVFGSWLAIAILLAVCVVSSLACDEFSPDDLVDLALICYVLRLVYSRWHLRERLWSTRCTVRMLLSMLDSGNRRIR